MYLFRTPLLQALIGFFELPEDDSIPDDEHFIDIEDTPGYQTAFSQLAFAGKKEHDPIGDAVGNPKILLAQSLHKLSTACPGRVSSQMQAVLFFFWFDSMCLESKNCHFGNHIDKHCTPLPLCAGSFNAEHESECRSSPLPAGLLTGGYCAAGLKPKQNLSTLQE